MVDFFKWFKLIPGGALIFPMLLTAVINTLFPQALMIGTMTTALFKNGTLCIAGLMLFASGVGIQMKSLGTVLRRSAVLTVTKLLIGFGLGLLYVRAFGLEGLWGINAVAFVTAMFSCNPGVYAGIVADCGDAEDMGSFTVMNVLAQPAFPVIVLAAASGGPFDWMTLVSILVPFVVGLILGNLDPRLAKVFEPVTPALLPFLGCCFGASVNLVTAFRSGLQGLLLSACYLVINMAGMLFADKVIGRRPGYAGSAWCAVAGTALSISTVLTGEEYQPYLAPALSQIALALIITSLACPFFTKCVIQKWGAPKAERPIG